MKESPEISIISPVFRAEHIIEKLVMELKRVLEQESLTYEIILVDDRSPDDSWPVMKQLAAKNPEVTSIRLSRNFGQHATIMAGLSHAKGNWVVVMDCDMQDQPKEIVPLYRKAQEGFDVVLARRTKRQDGLLKKMSSKLFYKTFNFFTGVDINSEIANFGIYNKKVISNLLRIGDALIFFPLFVKWAGFEQTSIEVEHLERMEGTSSYSWMKLFQLAFNTIISFSDKPLRLFLNFGITISLLSFIGAIYVFSQAVTGQIAIMGYSSIFIAICFFSGMIITLLGVIGIYLSKTFNQTKNRPIYIIDHVYRS